MRNLNSDVKASFCQQVDDRILLKIAEKIIQRNVFEKKKNTPGLSADRPSKSLRKYPFLLALCHWGKQKSSFYTPVVLWPLGNLRTTTKFTTTTSVD